jgi:hypothetical protein
MLLEYEMSSSGGYISLGKPQTWLFDSIQNNRAAVFEVEINIAGEHSEEWL